MIKAIIFDFDGTLSNRQENAYGVFRDYFRPYFKDMDDMEYESVLQDMMYYDSNGTISVKLRLVPFFYKYGSYLPEDFEEVFIPYYYDHMYQYTVLKDDTIDVLRQLKDDYKLAILTNGDSASQHSKITHVNIEQYFDEVVVSGDIGIHKPDKRIFEYVSEKLGVKLDECLMVGDVFSTDILGAYYAGIIPVWILKDSERPAHFYKGYRIEELSQLIDIIKQINEKE